jgi:L-iditol 2-dehydrogenase
MKSAVLSKGLGGKLMVDVLDVDPPTPGPGEMVVAMKACGLCGTDLEKIRGEYTASMPVIGHEAVGKVSALGDGVEGFRIGDPVFPHHHVPCYACDLCKAGSETMCNRYRTSNIVPGGFSEFFRVPRWNVEKGGVLKLPDQMQFEVASLIEPLACCVRALRRCKVLPGDSVLVVGAGPVGMTHALMLEQLGARVMLSDVSESRLGFATESGFLLSLNARKVDVPARVRAETEGEGADVAIVATGSKDAILQGLRSIRKGGRVCLFGVPARGSVLAYDMSELYNAEQQIITSYAATEDDTKEALRILASYASDFGKLVTNRFSISKFAEAVEVASSATAMKVVITP